MPPQTTTFFPQTYKNSLSKKTQTNLPNTLPSNLITANHYSQKFMPNFSIQPTKTTHQNSLNRFPEPPTLNLKPIEIKTSSGKIVELDPTKIWQSLNVAGDGLNKVDLIKIYKEVAGSLYHHISTDEITMLTIKTSSNYIWEHYQYSYLTSRLMLQKLYKEVFKESVYEYVNFYDEIYITAFDAYLEKGIAIGLIDPALKNYDLQKIKQAIRPERDKLFKEEGMGRIYNQYLLKTNTDKQEVFELPQFWLMRVAMGVCMQEENKEARAIEYYEALSTHQVIAATPTLLNAGRVRNQLSSCFLLTVEDSLEGIYKNYTDVAFLSKYAGGIGVDYTNIRASGSLIKGTNGKSLGLIPFLKTLDSSTAAVNQGGVRKGAVAVYLEPWHKDVFDFIASKYVGIDENRRCPNIHTVMWVPDLFMKRVASDEKWTLFSPSDVPDLHQKYGAEFEKAYIEYENNPSISKKVITAKELMQEIITSLLGKGFGHPWITFKDPSNAGNQQKHIGPINGSNLCTEILLPTNKEETAVCNLSHLNLASFYVDGQIDWQALEKAVRLLVRMLDNVISINFYTTKEAKNANTKHRPIGLGTLGLQTLLHLLEINMDSQEAVELNDKLYEFISYHSIDASIELAKERGAYSSFQGSEWSKGILPLDSYTNYLKSRGVEADLSHLETKTMDWDGLREKVVQNGLRNSQLTMVAPNRSTSYLVGASPSIEPWDSNFFTEVGMTGKYQMINNQLVDALEKEGLWNNHIAGLIKDNDGSVKGIPQIPEKLQRLFQTAWEIHPKWLISANARRQKWVDMSISFNMWMPSTNGSDALRLYMEAWKAGLKTTYYLHSKSKTQADKTSQNGQKSIPVISPAPVAPTSSTPKILADGSVCDLTDPECEACQ